jgi:hypothetical protein
MADLNVLDCIWVLARPSYGPSCSYAQATRLDALVAGTDPVAVDLWATKNLLVPAIVANGYSSYPMQDPDDPGSIFRTYLDASAAQLLAAGIDVTNDPAHITALRWSAVTAEPPAAGEPARVGAFPNPFAETTTIRPGTAEAGPLRVYDVTGRLVRTLAPAGADGRVTWDGRDDAGRVLPAGTYYLRGESPRGPVCGKVTRLR